MKIKINEIIETLVDDDLFPLLHNVNWFVNKNRRNGNIYIRSGTSRLHHYVIGHPISNLIVDHINGNTLDNRRENLRLVTHRQNQQNLAIHRNGKLSGTHWDKSRKKWRSHIEINGKNKHLGDFKTPEEAHLRYLEECKKLTMSQPC